MYIIISKCLTNINSRSIIFMLWLFFFTLPFASANQPELHKLDHEYADRYIERGWYILDMEFGDMEFAVAQVIRFYENFGWGLTNPIKHSGIALIYEDNQLHPDHKPLKAEVRTGALHKVFEYLTDRTRGAFRENIIDNRVLVVRKQVDSLLYNLEINPFKHSDISIKEALETVLDSANRRTKKFKIRLEIPHYVTPREGPGPRDWAIYQRIPASYFDKAISVNINGNKLIDGLAEILISQPIPFYLSLKKDTISDDYTHVLRFDSLPESVIENIERTHRRYFIR